MTEQAAIYRCDCGLDVLVERITAYEFHARCPRCGRVYVLSHAHEAPPPTFEGDTSPRLPLRSELHPADCTCDECSNPA